MKITAEKYNLEHDFYPKAAAHEVWEQLDKDQIDTFEKEKIFKDAFLAGAYYIKGCLEPEEE